MKLQHLAIIFVIIIVPISIVLSEYIAYQTKTIKYQAEYDSMLINSTYDAIKAFEINTINNNYSTINNSKIRDIEASVSTFYKSLATNFRATAYSEDDLKEYVPSILFTLYDGYYIYSKYEDTELGGYKFGLKPFMYYSCRYVNGSDDFVVNYTLDNSITVIGRLGGQYVNKSGYLINLNTAPDVSSISQEIVTENLMLVDNNTPTVESFEYLTYNGQKIYKSNDPSAVDRQRYFYYSSEYKQDFINSTEMIEYLNNHLINGHLYSDSAKKYYESAIEFTNWVNGSNLRYITQKMAVDSSGNQIKFSTDTQDEKIFATSNDNDPLKSESTFNENRMAVIRKSIETNLITSMQTFSNWSSAGYSFAMPALSEIEWYNVENNVAMVSFLQGLPIGGKVYNNYCVVSNNTNEEVIAEDSLYVIDSNGEYHKATCKKLISDLASGNVSIVGMYASTDFKRKSVSLTGADSNAHGQLSGSTDGDYGYYFGHSPTPNTAYTGCYDCIVTMADTYTIDDIVTGATVIDQNNRSINLQSLNGINYMQMFLTALARERYDIYITNGYLIN